MHTPRHGRSSDRSSVRSVLECHKADLAAGVAALQHRGAHRADLKHCAIASANDRPSGGAQVRAFALAHRPHRTLARRGQPSGRALITEMPREHPKRRDQDSLRRLLPNRPSAPALAGSPTRARTAHNVRFAIASRTPPRSLQQAARSQKRGCPAMALDSLFGRGHVAATRL